MIICNLLISNDNRKQLDSWAEQNWHLIPIPSNFAAASSCGFASSSLSDCEIDRGHGLDLDHDFGCDWSLELGCGCPLDGPGQVDCRRARKVCGIVVRLSAEV